GRGRAVAYHWFLILGGILSAVAFTIINYSSATQLLFLLTVPLFVINGRSVSKKSAAELDPFLKQMAISTLLFVLLFGLGILLR
ncbi:MAG: 1,4-dihydroxy-2-naphthoate polyprenyltransferase, partial [Cyclobacteriaceae bacterium]